MKRSDYAVMAAALVPFGGHRDEGPCWTPVGVADRPDKYPDELSGGRKFDQAQASGSRYSRHGNARRRSGDMAVHW